MRKLLLALFLSCLKATELMEKKMHFKLSLVERLQLKVHKMMCAPCRIYEKQSILLENGISLLDKDVKFSEDDLKSLKMTITNKLAELK